MITTSETYSTDTDMALDPILGPAQRCSGVKPVNWIPTLP